VAVREELKELVDAMNAADAQVFLRDEYQWSSSIDYAFVLQTLLFIH